MVDSNTIKTMIQTVYDNPGETTSVINVRENNGFDAIFNEPFFMINIPDNFNAEEFRGMDDSKKQMLNLDRLGALCRNHDFSEAVGGYIFDKLSKKFVFARQVLPNLGIATPLFYKTGQTLRFYFNNIFEMMDTDTGGLITDRICPDDGSRYVPMSDRCKAVKNYYMEHNIFDKEYLSTTNGCRLYFPTMGVVLKCASYCKDVYGELLITPEWFKRSEVISNNMQTGFNLTYAVRVEVPEHVIIDTNIPMIFDIKTSSESKSYWSDDCAGSMTLGWFINYISDIILHNIRRDVANDLRHRIEYAVYDDVKSRYGAQAARRLPYTKHKTPSFYPTITNDSILQKVDRYMAHTTGVGDLTEWKLGKIMEKFIPVDDHTNI